ncbi:hypothetical protein MUS_0284 [Bacillus velezensis YAU B9601-Y2]|uniref:Uncharacterized protein n=1 Tax=Bacillus amyloliquefaciens (strain Y2) TaxID=1155777 RepID=I2C142_BACAY|nr:hypothetical protein MUS_0284 [Bacillus velezensis YAU B9601-Y2]
MGTAIPSPSRFKFINYSENTDMCAILYTDRLPVFNIKNKKQTAFEGGLTA